MPSVDLVFSSVLHRASYCHLITYLMPTERQCAGERRSFSVSALTFGAAIWEISPCPKHLMSKTNAIPRLI